MKKNQFNKIMAVILSLYLLNFLWRYVSTPSVLNREQKLIMIAAIFIFIFVAAWFLKWRQKSLGEASEIILDRGYFCDADWREHDSKLLQCVFKLHKRFIIKEQRDDDGTASAKVRIPARLKNTGKEGNLSFSLQLLLRDKDIDTEEKFIHLLPELMEQELAMTVSAPGITRHAGGVFSVSGCSEQDGVVAQSKYFFVFSPDNKWIILLSYGIEKILTKMVPPDIDDLIIKVAQSVKFK